MDRCTGRHCRPVLQLPTGQFRSLQTAGPNNKLLALTDPGAHGNEQGKQTEARWNGASKLEANERGQTDEGQWAWQAKNGQQAHSPQNRQLQADTAGGLSARLRPQNKRPAVGRPCSKQQQPQSCPASCRAGRWGECKVLALRKAGSDRPKPVPSPPIAFACHCPYPLP